MTQPEQTQTLLDKARKDLQALNVLAAEAEVADEIVGFHAQQAVEKALKAVLAAARIPYTRTHNLRQLIGLLGEARIQPPDWMYETTALTPFGAALRYANLELDEPFDRPSTCRLVERLLDWAAERVQEIA